MKRLLSLLLSLVLILSLLVACDSGNEPGATTIPTSGTVSQNTTGGTAATAAGGRTVLAPAIDRELFGGSGSYDSLAASIEAILASGAYRQPIMYSAMPGMAQRNGATSDATAEKSSGTGAPASGGDQSYSTTNVQVAGVDEGDTVKTDGRYLYYVANNRVYVIDAIDKADVVYTWSFKRNTKDGKMVTSESPIELYLDPVGKRLTMIIQGYQYEPVTPPTKPVETKPAETKPAETKPAETKPAETRPAVTGAKTTPPSPPDATVTGSSGAVSSTGAISSTGASANSGSGSGVSISNNASVADMPAPAVDLPANGVSSKYGFAPYPTNQRNYVTVRVYSMADPKAPRLLRTHSQEGNYVSSRLVDGTAYVLSTKQDFRIYQMGMPSVGAMIVDDIAVPESAPAVKQSAGSASGSVGSAGSAGSAATGAAGVSGSIEPAAPKTAVTSETTAPKQTVDPKVLKESLPKVTKDPEKDAWEVLPADRIGIVPQGDPSAHLVISAVSVANEARKVETISLIGASGIVFASKDNIYVANYVYGRINGTTKKYEQTQPSMKIYRLHITGGQVAADGTGSVPGTAINQFAMDEYNGYFRIATTLQGFASTPNQTRNQTESTVYVLDKGLKIVGEVGKLGPGETIRSVRFLGDRAYVVTFRTTDPLYVLDLKTPTAPKVLGELKIPGFSTYLHPYGENQLIGFGYDAVVEGNNAYQTGIKVSLFDISDVSKPKELSTLIFGGRGSNSALDQSHKALLFSQEKNLIAFPAVLNTMSGNDKMTYRYLFQGLIALKIENDKLVLRGGISNSPNLKLNGDGVAHDKLSQADQRALYGQDSITRAVLLGDRIVTLSSHLVRQYGLDSLKLAGETQLSGSDDINGGYGIREAMPALK